MFIGKRQWLRQFTRTSVLFAATVVLSALFHAQSAVASCGDYVMVGGHANDGHAGGDSTDHDATNYDATNYGPTVPGVPTCQGPNCQRQSPLPLAPTKGPSGGLPSDVAYWLQNDGSVERPVRGSIFENRISLADGHSLPLLRPPCR